MVLTGAPLRMTTDGAWRTTTTSQGIEWPTVSMVSSSTVPSVPTVSWQREDFLSCLLHTVADCKLIGEKGKGATEGSVCTPHATFGRIVGNTNHGHGRFGHCE